MSVFDGPRQEIRRILHGGVPCWVTLDGDELVLGDGRRVKEAAATYLAPCEPTKILCIHLNYESRRIEFRAPELVTPTYFQKPTTALNAHRGTLCRPANTQYLNYEGGRGGGRPPMRNVAPPTFGATSPASRPRTTWARRTSATRRRLDAARGPGRLLPDRPRPGARRRRAPERAAHLAEREARAGGRSRR
jgi:hypothetical protein